MHRRQRLFNNLMSSPSSNLLSSHWASGSSHAKQKGSDSSQVPARTNCVWLQTVCTHFLFEDFTSLHSFEISGVYHMVRQAVGRGSASWSHSDVTPRCGSCHPMPVCTHCTEESSAGLPIHRPHCVIPAWSLHHLRPLAFPRPPVSLSWVLDDSTTSHDFSRLTADLQGRIVLPFHLTHIVLILTLWWAGYQWHMTATYENPEEMVMYTSAWLSDPQTLNRVSIIFSIWNQGWGPRRQNVDPSPN